VVIATLLTHWDPEHLQKLKAKFEARGLEVVISEDGTSAVIEGQQWASLELIKGSVRTIDITDMSRAASLLD
jgi:hypothetical protein